MPPSYLMQSLCWPIGCFLCLNFHSLEGHCLPTTGENQTNMSVMEKASEWQSYREVFGKGHL